MGFEFGLLFTPAEICVRYSSSESEPLAGLSRCLDNGSERLSIERKALRDPCILGGAHSNAERRPFGDTPSNEISGLERKRRRPPPIGQHCKLPPCRILSAGRRAAPSQ